MELTDLLKCFVNSLDQARIEGEWTKPNKCWGVINRVAPANLKIKFLIGSSNLVTLSPAARLLLLGWHLEGVGHGSMIIYFSQKMAESSWSNSYEGVIAPHVSRFEYSSAGSLPKSHTSSNWEIFLIILNNRFDINHPHVDWVVTVS